MTTKLRTWFASHGVSTADEGIALDESLSVIVPVHNAQTSLARHVGQWLEVLPELTHEFEVIIVDDASTDQTEEVAVELARQFPQVRLARHARQQGAAEAVQIGLLRASGEIILVCDELALLSPNGLRHLWELRHDQRLVMARTSNQPQPFDAGLIRRLMAWRTALGAVHTTHSSSGTIQMIRRRAVEQLHEAHFSKRYLSTDRVARADLVKCGRAKQKPPNFFARLSNFANGE